MIGDEHRQDLWHLYDTAVQEYRFQVQLNTQRFQWYVGLNFALIAVAGGLLRIGERNDGTGVVVVTFAAGIVLALFTWLVTTKQTKYYRAARDKVVKIAAELGVSEWSIETTSGFKRDGDDEDADGLPKVRTVNTTLLCMLALLHASGIAYVAFIR